MGEANRITKKRKTNVRETLLKVGWFMVIGFKIYIMRPLIGPHVKICIYNLNG
jgi:hypothetical protein